MNKHIFYIAAACAALASCVKNEVRVNAPDKEITFQTVSTKAGGAAFETNKHFFSYAYFLEKGKSWDDADLDLDKEAKPYIDKAVITYDHGTTQGQGHWVAANSYYWPKQGSLTFFAWTDNTIHDPANNPAPSVGTGATVSCAPNTGIKIENYSVKGNPNKDILVAEIAKDKRQNESVTEPGRDWDNGVPTVFRHALANVEFNVNKREDYKNVKFRVREITLNNVFTKGTFTQGSPTESWGWSAQTEPDGLSVFKGDKEVNTTATKLNPNSTSGATDYFIVLPQNFDNDTPTLTIKYEIITSYVAGKQPVTETVTETKALNTIYPDNWKIGKKYVLGITLGLNEIFWDPSIVDWATINVPGIEI